MPIRNAILFSIAAASLLLAADSNSTLTPRRLDMLPKQEFQQVFARSFDKPPAITPAITMDQFAKIDRPDALCSIPLSEAKVRNPEKTPQALRGATTNDRIGSRLPFRRVKTGTNRNSRVQEVRVRAISGASSTG